MRNRVGLYIRIELPTGERRYCKTHPKDRWAIVNGQPERHPEGSYHLRYKLGDKQTWEKLRGDYKTALHIKSRREAQILAGVLAVAPLLAEDAAEATLTLEIAIEKYLANITALKSEKTSDGYAYTLNQFKESCKKINLKTIRKQDLTDFIVFLKQQELSDRTISNRVGEVVTFLRANDIKDVTARHKYTEKVVKAYHPDEVKLLLCASTPEEWLILSFFLTTGCREQEVTYATWADVDFKRKVFTVKDHPEYGFKPKDYEERPIPLTDAVLAKLEQRVRTSDLIFPTKQGKPNGHFLRMLKENKVCPVGLLAMYLLNTGNPPPGPPGVGAVPLSQSKPVPKETRTKIRTTNASLLLGTVFSLKAALEFSSTARRGPLFPGVRCFHNTYDMLTDTRLRKEPDKLAQVALIANQHETASVYLVSLSPVRLAECRRHVS